MENENDKPKKGFHRRDFIKGLAGVPVLGGLLYGAWSKDAYAAEKSQQLNKLLNIQSVPPPQSGSMEGDTLRLGIIGFGIRGEQLVRDCGYPTPAWLERAQTRVANGSRTQEWLDSQVKKDLNVVFTAVCDLFDNRRELAATTVTTDTNTPKKYKRHEDLMADPNVDAVIIATADHWHAPLSIAALQSGKHVYVEKPMTHKVGETFALRDAVAAHPKQVFAVGHQHRQTESFLTAQDIIQKEILGHVSLAEFSTNRNDDNGAWQYKIDPDANPNTVDWQRFLGPHLPKIPWNAEHFFRWRKWWAYGSGLTGDLLTHDYDRLNCVLNVGIPASCVASGGIYTHRDGREVPDVLQVAMEFPDYYRGGSQDPSKEKGLTFLYSASLGNNHYRPSTLMGHDATMSLGSGLEVVVDGRSTRYAEELKSGKFDGGEVIYTYNPGGRNVDGVTSATSKYFADKGLLYTYRGGKRVSSTYLHLREWLSCIRHGGTPSCSIKEGFEEAIAAHMATLAVKSGQATQWDAANDRLLVGGTELSYEEMDRLALQSDIIPLKQAAAATEPTGA